MAEALNRFEQETLIAIMERGRKTPITGKELAAVVGLKPRKNGKEGADMRAIINALRCKEYPICASGAGYWWPSSQSELNDYIAAFTRRLDDQSKAINGMRMGFDKVNTSVVKLTVTSIQKTIYEVLIEGKKKYFQVVGTRVAEFLAKYPDAKKL